ncbi:MAG: bifunctional phosphopantothenoylcysteine decarboxylase/phosphopantothenate--cysteine ligase CoaBC [Rhodospirillaceae bacterium]|nr:bifunctional phosphopantothenoylcysteine decarboxylase/phosphopantothenate--cysteine ligase CoaBC [Rhodospirillaceae bacterium]
MTDLRPVTTRVLLIISGGIAAYKSLELIRLLTVQGIAVRCVLTRGGAQFVTPLSLAALSGDTVYGDLFSLTDEGKMGHIELSRDADLLLVAPATADILAKMRAGLADDLATTALLATDKPVMAAPAMNVRMWDHAATQENIQVLRDRGISVIGPDAGDMACGEYGMGRMPEPAYIAAAVLDQLRSAPRDGKDPSRGRLAGKKALVTSGPTHEPLDPVRYIANRSSGRQGHAIAAALAAEGAETILISGPTVLADPPGVTVKKVGTALDMMAACTDAMPADIAVCAAAVADWRAADPVSEKIKKNGRPPHLDLVENPDILASLSQASDSRPTLVVGFAAETGAVVEKAQAKRARKGCDWIIANDVSPGTDTFGGMTNTVHMVDGKTVENWPTMTKEQVGTQLAGRIAAHFE